MRRIPGNIFVGALMLTLLVSCNKKETETATVEIPQTPVAVATRAPRSESEVATPAKATPAEVEKEEAIEQTSNGEDEKVEKEEKAEKEDGEEKRSVALSLSASIPSQKELDNALLSSSHSGDAESVKKLVNAGADLDVRRRDGMKPLWIAASENQDPEVSLLLVTSSQDDLDKALFYAASDNCPEVATTLIGAGATVDRKDRKGRTPLMYAAMRNQNPEMLESLVSHGADMETVSHYGENALSLALGNSLSMAKKLIDLGADVNGVTIDGKPLLTYAIAKGMDGKVVSYLIEHGADIGAKDREGCTPFMAAVDMDSYDIAKMLLEKGSDVDGTDFNGRTALMRAAQKGDMDAVKALVEEAHADTTLTDKFGFSAGTLAQRAGREEVAKFLGVTPQKGRQFSLRRSYSQDGYHAECALSNEEYDVRVTIKTHEGKGTIDFEGVDASLVSSFMEEECQEIEGLGFEMDGDSNLSISYQGHGLLDDQIVTDWLLEDAISKAY